jgi:ATP-dependent DNA ligase
MAARTTDKIAATLPGGNLGQYQITGFSSRLIEALGFSEAALRDAIAKAASDAEVAAWIAEHSDPARYAEINAALEGRTIEERLDDPGFLERYPIARRLPPETSRLDLLIADDNEYFSK